MRRIPELRRASHSARLWTPGSPKATSTPSASRSSTISCAPVGIGASNHVGRRANLDTTVSGFARLDCHVDALTINEAAAITGWSARMLRYVERVGLVEPTRSPSGYRLFGPAE